MIKKSPPLRASIASALTFAVAVSMASAQEIIKPFNIAAQPLSKALVRFSKQADIIVIAPAELVSGKRASAIRGDMSPEEALRALLEGSGLSYSRDDQGITLVPVDSGAIRTNKNTLKAMDAFIFEEIVVTAQKREQNIMDVPMSIVALTTRELEIRRIEDFEDLGLAVPGLAIADEGPGSRRIYLRGIGNNFGSSALVGIYLDEISTAGHPQNNLDLRIYDLERVEVLRGPQGTIYGQGSVGGTIRFITKQPDLERLAAHADLSALFTDDGAPSQKIVGMVNMPLGDTVGLRVSGVYDNAGGWIDQPAVSESNINDQNLANVRAKLLWQPSDTVEINTMVNIHRNDAGATSVGENEDGNYTQVFGRTTTPSTDDDYEIYNLTGVFDLGGMSLLSTSSYSNSRNERREYGSVIPFFPPPAPPFHTSFLPFNIQAKNFNQELRLNSTAADPVQWSVGGFYQNFTLENSGFQLFGLPDSAAPFPFPLDNEETSESWAVFGSASVELMDWLELGAGLRYFEDKREFVDSASATQKGTFDSVSPRVFVNADVGETAKIYASAAKGFRSGGFNNFGAASYEPEEVWTYELGTKASFLEALVNAELAVYYSEYNGYQINALLDTPDGVVTRIANIGDAEIAGVDAKLSWRILDSLTIEASGSYVDTEVVKVDALSASHQVGDPIDYIPKYQFSVSAIHDFNLFGRAAYFQIDYNQQGRSNVRLRNIGPHFFGQSDVIKMLNVNTTWWWSDHLSLGLFAKNLLNERGFLDPSSINANAARPRPRTIGFQVILDF